jgi:bacterioferritin
MIVCPCINARNHCDRMGDRISKYISEALLGDQGGRTAFLEKKINLCDMIGAAGFGRASADAAGKAK